VIVMSNRFAVSLNCYTWGDYDVAQCLEQIVQTPIRRVELPAEQMRPGSLVPELMLPVSLHGNWRYSLPDLEALLDSHGLAVDSLDVFGFLGYPGSEEIIKRRVDFAGALGAEMIVLGMHHVALAADSAASADDQEAVRQAIYQILREVADYAAERGVRLALEIHGGITANATEARRTLEEVGRDNLGINFDTANILYYNADLDSAGGAEALRMLADRVFHVHLKDIVRGATPAEHVLPRLGLGMVDFPRVFSILTAAGFQGVYSFEVEAFHGATEATSIEPYQADLLASIEYVRSLGQFPA
jgi:L-ribulose-5-phosphate 3-epimerase